MNPIVNSAIKKAGNVVEDLKEQLDVIDKYTYEKLEKVVGDIDAKNQELTNLNSTYKEKLRQAEVDLKLKVQENEAAVIIDVCKRHNKVMVDIAEYEALKNRVQKHDDVTSAEVSKATNALKSRLEAQAKADGVDTQIRIAKLEAELEQANSRNEFLTGQVDRLNKEVDAAGERIVKVAEAQQSAAVTIGK